MKIGRNQPCPCGSGKKYKRCCGDLDARRAASVAARAQDMARALEQHRAAELIRQRQQGHGRPIIGAKVGDYQTVAVGSKLYWQKDCKTFGDFLMRYIKEKLE